MLERLKNLDIAGAAGPYEDFVRPAIVLGAVLVVSLGVALFGGGESSAAGDSHDPVAVVESGDGHGSEATVEEDDGHGSEATTGEDDGHGSEAVTEEDDGHGSEATTEEDDSRGSEATTEEDGGDGAEATPGPTATPVATFTIAPTATAVTSEIQWTDFVSGEFDVSFKYEVTPNGFRLEQFRTPEEERVVLWTLTRAREASTAEGDVPPGLSIAVYAPDPMPSDARAWVEESAHSHYPAEGGEMELAIVGGAMGVRYSWAEPDEVMSAVVEFDGRIWVFSSTYRELSRGSFDVLLDSVVFWK